MSVQILPGDCRAVLPTLPAASVQCVVTSPPYWGLRDYGVENQLGLEPTPEEYVARLVDVFREVRRVLRDDGTLWLNMGDSYASGLKPKDLVGMPWMLAKALQAPYYTGRIAVERDRAWLAGIMDGEGSVSAFRHTRADDGRPRTGIGIFVTNCNVPLLDECDRIWQASRQQRQKPTAGHLGLRPCWRWIVHGNDNKMLLLRELYPYLVAKRRQAVVAYNLLLLVADAKRLGHSSQRDAVRERRAFLVDIVQKLNRADAVDLPAWLVEPPSPTEPGWYLRADIVWAKPNPMPESVTDRPTKAHEYVFLLTKSARYYYDAEAVREPASGRASGKVADDRCLGHDPVKHRTRAGFAAVGDVEWTARNLRSVWTIPSAPFPEAHFATFPPALASRCIQAGTSEKGCCAACGAPWAREVERTPMIIDRSSRTHALGRTRSSGTVIAPATATTTAWQPSCACDAPVVPCSVLDPFGGSGTVGAVAEQLGRHSILIELSPAYVRMAEARTAQRGLFAQDAPAARYG